MRRLARACLAGAAICGGAAVAGGAARRDSRDWPTNPWRSYWTGVDPASALQFITTQIWRTRHGLSWQVAYASRVQRAPPL